jgi:HK97 family phage prohead protease
MSKSAPAAAVETRHAAAAPLEIRDADGGAGVAVAGYAAIFNERAEIGGYFEEVIAPGAFDGRLGDDCVFLVDHEGLPLARTTSGTLKLSVDARGLYAETVLDAADPDAARVIAKLRRGDLSKMSFAFRVEKESWDESGEVPLRTIERIAELRDVSVVTRPAYAGTEIALRGLEASRAAARGPETQTARLRRMRMQLALQEG